MRLMASEFFWLAGSGIIINNAAPSAEALASINVSYPYNSIDIAFPILANILESQISIWN